MNKTHRYYSIAFLLLFVHTSLSFADAPRSVPAHSGATASFQAACADTIIITLNAQCQYTLSYDNLLTGDLTGCSASDFTIFVEDEDPSNGAIVDGCGIFRYAIEASSTNSCSDFERCWGYIKAEDKAAPVIVPPNNTTLILACEQLDQIKDNAESLDVLGRATVSDNCRPTSTMIVTFSDAVQYSDHCGTIVVTRTFRTEDDKGNRATAQQIITLQEPDLNDITVDTDFILDADCQLQEEVARDKNGAIHPDVSGYPYYVNGLGDTIYIQGDHCNLAVTYTNEDFSICATQEKTSRTWTIADWCSGQQMTWNQTIKFGDVDPPVLSCAQDTLRASTDPFACTATVALPFPEVNDLCGPYKIAVEFYTIQHTGPHGFSSDPDTILFRAFPFSSGEQQVIIHEVPLGQHFARFIVQDECKNSAELNCPVIVADQVSPTLSCDDQINLSLNSDGYGQLLASEISEGTNDNCGVALLEVRRLYEESPDDCTPLSVADTFYSEWNSFVEFSCCDIGQLVTIELRAFDIYGNVSVCWGTVLVEDKVTPRCVPPNDVTIACDAIPGREELSRHDILNELFGTPSARENCAASITEETPVVSLDDCDEGTITRIFTVANTSGTMSDECQQVITVEAKHDYAIRFPHDYEEFCMEPSPDSVFFVENACDLLAVSINDDILQTQAPECYKIFRTYRVINWCEYDGQANPVVVPRDVDCDQKPGDENVWVIRRRDGTVYYDADSLETNSFPAAGSRDEICEIQNPEGYWYNSDTVPEITSRGFWEYEQHIKVNDQIPPEIFFDEEVVFCSDSDDCSGDVSVSFAVTDNCVTDVDIHIDVIEGPQEYFEFSEDPFRVIGRYPKYILDGKVPEGDYRIELEASDRCGNVTRVIFSLRVVDCKPPSPICINGLATELMPLESGTDADGDGDEDTGAMTVFVGDFLASDSPVSDCTGPVTYSINRKGEAPNREQDFLVLTCDDPAYLEVEIHAWDNADNPFNISDEGMQGGPNHDYCLTYILVQDNMFSLCDTTSAANGLQVSGTIQTAAGLPVPGVTIQTNNNDLRSAVATDERGYYLLSGFAPGYDYSVTPSKDDNHLAGVSTFDIVQISKHILNLKPFDSPYKHIAADVNGSGTITTLDLIQLRRLVLNLHTELPNTSSWRFVRADYPFFYPHRAEAEVFPTTFNLNNLTQDWPDADFIGIKMGDINESALLRSSASLRLPEQSLKAGEYYSVPLYLDGANQGLEGLQAALQLRPGQVELAGVKPGQIGEEYLNWQQESNRLFISWDAFSSSTRALRADKPLLTLQLRARSTTRISASVDLAPRYLLAEAYTGDGRMTLNLNFAQETTVQDQLGSLFPNPFVERLQVQFLLAEAQTITWTLTDARGRSVRSWTEARDAGQQQLILHANDVTGPGVYYLHLQTKNSRFTHRIVHLR